MAYRTNLQTTVDAHLRRLGSSLPEFLQAATDRGDSSQQMADELARITDIKVSHMTAYRWAKSLAEAVTP